jgi:hypothetical protein
MCDQPLFVLGNMYELDMDTVNHPSLSACFLQVTLLTLEKTWDNSDACQVGAYISKKSDEFTIWKVDIRDLHPCKGPILNQPFQEGDAVDVCFYETIDGGKTPFVVWWRAVVIGAPTDPPPQTGDYYQVRYLAKFQTKKEDIIVGSARFRLTEVPYQKKRRNKSSIL